MIKDFQSLLAYSNSPTEPQSPLALSGRELQELLSPISCEEFANSYFSRLSLYVKGHPEKFDHVFNWESLKRALSHGRNIEDKRFNLKASYASGEESGSSKPMFDVSIGQVGELLNSGATICITNIHMADRDLARWAHAIRRQLNFTGTVGVNCYVSPDGAGLPMHYDRRVATTLQIAGKKRWIFSTTPSKDWPGTNGLYKDSRIEPPEAADGKRPDELELREVELQPGDLLCLPAGTWHAARGVGFSLALNLYFAPRNLFDQLAPLFMEFAVSNENWRGGPPVEVEGIHGKMPGVVSGYLRERLDEFHQMVRKMLEQPDALSASWLNSLVDSPYTGWQPGPVMQPPKATSEDQFRVAKELLRFIETRDKVLVPSDHGLLKFPIKLAPILHRLSSEKAAVSVPEILSWRQDPNEPPAKEVVATLQVLYSIGVLQKV
jgi:ribosomal protein L16 Arg81 hydroxylase